MALNDSQLERYARHIVLKEIGGAGQARLLASRVAVVGAGGLGSPCLQYLAAAGIGQITIIDDDHVDLSNLQRQVIHSSASIGRAKTESAADAIAALNPDVEVTAQQIRLSPETAAALLVGHDIIADGSDSFATRRAVADAALALKIPLVAAAVGPFEGQLSVYRGYDPALPCWRCFVGEAADRGETSCAATGVLGALAGILGAMQAMEVIREIIGFGDSLAGRVLLYDALSAQMRTVRLPKDPECPACSTL